MRGQSRAKLSVEHQREISVACNAMGFEGPELTKGKRWVLLSMPDNASSHRVYGIPRRSNILSRMWRALDQWPLRDGWAVWGNRR
jgi:hypothetical protein